jgi:hypothetical protein
LQLNASFLKALRNAFFLIYQIQNCILVEVRLAESGRNFSRLPIEFSASFSIFEAEPYQKFVFVTRRRILDGSKLLLLASAVSSLLNIPDGTAR